MGEHAQLIQHKPLYDQNNYQKQIKYFENRISSTDTTIYDWSFMLFEHLLTYYTKPKIIELGCGNSIIALEACGASVLSFTKDKERKEYFESRLDPGKLCLWDLAV